MGLKIHIVLESQEINPVTLTSDRVILGWAELDDTGKPRAGIIELGHQIPEILHQIADQLESGMTTGLDL